LTGDSRGCLGAAFPVIPYALPVAVEMAGRFGSAVTVVHVREHTKYEGSDVDLGPETPADELVEAALAKRPQLKLA
jgi:nucleotide-binding universal stress UspA family protein